MRSSILSLLAIAAISSVNVSSSRSQVFSSNAEPEIFSADSSRVIAELNSRDTSGAYPWLSSDGLRLYYTWCGDGRGFRMAVRGSVSEPFGAVRDLNLMLDDNGHLSCWLTEDELSAYFVMHHPVGTTVTTLYHADREARDMRFSEPVAVELRGEISGFLSGPSLTKDRKFLYLYNDCGTGRKRILEFKRVKENVYRLFDTLPSPDGLEVGPGQLSKSDLRFYVGVKEGGRSKTLGCYYRESTSVPFRSFVLLDGYLTDTNNAAHLPTLSGDESVVVFSASNDRLWAGNRLYVAQRPAPVIVSEVPVAASRPVQFLSIYPNPVRDVLHVEFRSSDEAESIVSVFDVSGNEIRQLSVPEWGTHLEIDVSDLPSGPYSCRSRTATGSSELYGFVVVR